MSVGVNLTSCHHMVFNDAPWVPADMAQAEGRIHRIGQSRSCFYYYILASRVDQRIFRTLAAKRALLEKAT
jgi:SNF2 family DNA or RNA helicase